MSIYNFEANLLDGTPQALSAYKGQVLLIVNVASQCGFTPQYEGLMELYEKYRDRGFAVLGFPCNQFGSQEPGTAEEIRGFCTTRYNVSFPIFARIEVNGNNTHPLYRFLKQEQKGILGTGAVKWNFTKFLIDGQGQVIKRYAPQDTPASIAGDIEALLGPKP